MIALVYICWRFDRRLYRIELHLFNGKKKRSNNDAGS